VGYIADRGEHNSLSVPLWVEGEPESSRFLGLSAGLKVKDRARYEVLTYRCRLCGLLKAYAPVDRAK
jgi:hypothetical protein